MWQIYNTSPFFPGYIWDKYYLMQSTGQVKFLLRLQGGLTQFVSYDSV